MKKWGKGVACFNAKLNIHKCTAITFDIECAQIIQQPCTANMYSYDRSFT